MAERAPRAPPVAEWATGLAVWALDAGDWRGAQSPRGAVWSLRHSGLRRESTSSSPPWALQEELLCHSAGFLSDPLFLLLRISGSWEHGSPLRVPLLDTPTLKIDGGSVFTPKPASL